MGEESSSWRGALLCVLSRERSSLRFHLLGEESFTGRRILSRERTPIRLPRLRIDADWKYLSLCSPVPSILPGDSPRRGLRAGQDSWSRRSLVACRELIWGSRRAGGGSWLGPCLSLKWHVTCCMSLPLNPVSIKTVMFFSGSFLRFPSFPPIPPSPPFHIMPPFPFFPLFTSFRPLLWSLPVCC